MTNIEVRALEVMSTFIPRIARELKRANELKALELAGRVNPQMTPEQIPEQIDKIMKD